MKNTTYGKVLNRERHSQCLDFSGIARGKMTPTDLDGVIDYHGRAWILMEIKYNSEPIPDGQRICFNRLTSTLNKEAPALFIIADHYTEDPREDVDVSRALVREWSTGGRWIKQCEPLSVGTLIDRFLTIIDEPPTEEEEQSD